MREIKFRYWNSVINQMVTNPEMPYKEGWTIEQLFSDRGWVWQQFTGLKDKNGKEIYEGDIIRVREKSLWGGEYRAKVEWLSNWSIYGINCFDVVAIKDSDLEDKIKCRGFITRHFKNYIDLSEIIGFESCEIIGNFYEHPELLKS